MTIDDHLTELYGLPVQDYSPGQELIDADEVAWRLRLDERSPSFLDHLLLPFLDEPDVGRVQALVIGSWTQDLVHDSSEPVLEAMAAQAHRLPSLRALFLGDITDEESEISGIRHGDLTMPVETFPGLEEYGVRCGAQEITMRPLASRALRRLTFESSGLPAEVVRAVGTSDLPNLEHLELWLGSDEYGGGAEMHDLEPILSGRAFPSLQRLGLRDAAIADELAEALSRAPVVARLKVLDLSLGTLGDAGALALLRGQSLSHLSLLDLHHHYLSDSVMAHVNASGLPVDLSDQQPDGAGGRCVAIAD